MMAAARVAAVCAFGIGCVALLAGCGGSSGGGSGGSGGPCEPETDASLCAAAGAECGTTTVVDRCGAERTPACGGCEEPLWCGGAGVANRCGATCSLGCPDGWSCDDRGVCAGGDRADVALDLRTVTVRGRVLLEGVAPRLGTCTQYAAAVSFSELVNGSYATAYIPCDPTFPFEVELPPGSYRVSVWNYQDGTSNLPAGSLVLPDALAVEAPRSDLELDVRTVEVAGRVTLNGAPPQVSLACYDYTAVVNFTETTTGTSVNHYIPCDASDFAYRVSVPPGTYSTLVYKYREEDSNLPSGWLVPDAALRVDGPATGVDLDLRPVEVAGRLTLNGAVPEVNAGCYDHTTIVNLTETTTGASATTYVPCDARDFSFAVAVAPGTYAVSVMRYREDDSNLPPGQFVVDPALRVDGPRSGLVLDLRTVEAAGRILRNGAAPRVNAGCRDYTAQVAFTETTTGATGSYLVPCDDESFSFALAIAPGTYAVSVSKYRDEDSNLPDGGFLLDPALRIDGPTDGVELDLRPVPVSGSLTWNGRVPELTAACSDNSVALWFRSGPSPMTWPAWDPGSFASVRIPCSATAFDWDVELLPGDYLVGVYPYRPDASNVPNGTYAIVNRLGVR